MADGGERWGDAGALRDGYEQLRSAVLSGGAGGWRLGHGVLSARGMTGWMSAFGELASPARADARPPRSSSERPEAPAAALGSLPDADRIVAVLVQMVLPLAA